MADLMIKTGEYEKDGEKKNRYTRVGVMLESDYGPYLLLDPTVSLAGCLAQQQAMNPKSSRSVMVNIFDNEKKQEPPTIDGTANTSSDLDDDIPF